MHTKGSNTGWSLEFCDFGRDGFRRVKLGSRMCHIIAACIVDISVTSVLVSVSVGL